MKFHVLTLFPEMIRQGLGASIIGRAAEKNIISLEAVDIRDYTQDKHGKVDDYPYGGGAGMLMQAQPVYDAYQAVTGGRRIRTVYVTPQGIPFTQGLAQELAREEELVFLCGHYEGIDERVLEEVVTDYVSIGDYVLTGGELPAMVMIDAISRLISGVLGNDSSPEEESFHNDLLEYPQYSRPESWHDRRVPEVLLSGDHRKIAAWRREQSQLRTACRRPDLYEKYQEKQRLIQFLSRDKRNNIHMMESLASGRSQILWAQGKDILLYDRRSGVCTMLAENETSGRALAERVPQEVRLIVTSQEFLNDFFTEKQYKVRCQCGQVLYTQREPLPVKHKDIRRLTLDSFDYVQEHCWDSGSYVRGRIEAGDMYGAFLENQLVGFIGLHSEGSLGMLFVEESCRRQGIAASLEAYAVNRLLERGRIPYGHVMEGNEASDRLQERLGFYRAKKTFWWLEKNTCN